jgi:hypothetical protein
MKQRVSAKRARADVLREQRNPGVSWLPKPVTLSPGGSIRVLGVSNDAPRSLWKWWLRESHERGITEEAA